MINTESRPLAKKSGKLNEYLPLLARVVSALLCIVILGGCAAGKGPRVYDYDDEFDRWTRTVKIYDGIETVAIVNATYKTSAFVEAYVNKYAKSIQADEDYTKVILEGQLSDLERYNEIFLTLYTPDEKWNDLVRLDASIWRLYLEDGSGARLQPVSIRRVDRDDVMARQFFPYYDEWNVAYVIQFPKYAVTSVESVPGKNAKTLTFTITGILGEGKIKWGLEE